MPTLLSAVTDLLRGARPASGAFRLIGGTRQRCEFLDVLEDGLRVRVGDREFLIAREAIAELLIKDAPGPAVRTAPASRPSRRGTTDRNLSAA